MSSAVTTSPHAALDRAVQAHIAGRLDQAEQLYRESLRTTSPHPKAVQFLGVLLFQSRDRVEGLALLERAVLLTPNDSEAWSNLGNAYRVLSRGEQAIAALKKAVSLNPQNASAFCTLSACLRKEDTLSEAIEAARTAIRIAPNLPLGHCNLGNCLLEAGDSNSAIAAFQQALYLQPNLLDARQSLVFAMNYSDRTSARQIVNQAASFASFFPEVRAKRPNRAAETIGFLSGDFRQHPVAYFLEPILHHLADSGLRTVLFTNSAVRDSWTERLTALATTIVDVVDVPATEVQELARQQKVDVMVDLAGHTAANRADAVARRLAPVQVSYLGFSGTTGLPNLDWILADPALILPHEDALYTEKVLRMPCSVFSFDAHRVPAPGSRLPFEDNGFITFGSLNNVSKLSQACLQSWCEILTAVPKSKLLIKSLHLGETSVRERVMQLFQSQGIDSNRVTCLGYVQDHFALVSEIDIALDSFPYTGATTTCECLASGVPVVTLAGDRYSSRMSASILSAVGRPEWVSHTVEDYVKVGADLALNVDSLRDARSTLHRQVLASPLCDKPAHARHFLDALNTAWQATPTE